MIPARVESGLIAQFGAFIFVKDVKKDDAAIGDDIAVFADFLQAAVGLPASLAVIVNEAVLFTTDIFFEPAPMEAAHLTVRVSRVHQKAVDNPYDSLISGPIMRFDLLEFFGKVVRRLVKIRRHEYHDLWDGF